MFFIFILRILAYTYNHRLLHMPVSEITVKKTSKRIAAVLGVLFVLYLAYVFADILLMLAISVLLALIFNPFVTGLEKKGLSRSLSILIIIAVFGILIFLGFSYLVPRLSDQLTTLSESVNQTKIREFLADLDHRVTRYVPFIKQGTLAARLESWLSRLFLNFIDSLTYFLSSLVSFLAISVIIPFMTFFILKDNKEIAKGILNIMPNRYFEMSYAVYKKISIQLGRFVRGWIFDAFMVGLLSGVGLSILGIENAIPIGIIAGLGHLIPYFGPVVGGVPAIIISLVQFGNFSMLPSIVLLFIIIYTIDNGLIQPNVFAKSVDMHPLMIIVLMLIGSQVLGVFGLLLAVPIATVLKTASKEIYNGYSNYAITKM